jgi:uncharacterized membrane-anchored protein YjiN (DUF445 family)
MVDMSKSNNNKIIKELFTSLNYYLSNDYNYSKLEDDFYDQFVECDEDLDENQEEYFSDICEKMDYTSKEKLTQEEKKIGWITEGEFKKWLKEKLSNIPNDIFDEE